MAQGWSLSSFQTNGVTITYYNSTLEQVPTVAPASLSAPSPLPVLVFLHFLLGSGAAMIPIASQLTNDFNVFLPDARGHGGCQPVVPGSFRRSWLISDVVSFIKHVSPTRKVFLLGHSMGASMAARVAKEHPDRILGLIVEEPPWRRGDGDPIDPKKRTIPAKVLDNIRALKNLSEEQFRRLDIQARNMPKFAESFMSANRRFDLDDCAATFFICDDEINEGVEDIVVPTLLQFGNPDTGSMLDPASKEKVFATWPLGRASYYPAGNHFLHVGQYESRWIEEVKQFFNQILDRDSTNASTM